MSFVLFVALVAMAFRFTRVRYRKVRALIWLFIGASFGPYLLDSASLLSLARVYLWPNPTHDQIEISSNGPTLFAPDGLFIEYPAGVRILATRPDWGTNLAGLSLFYPVEDGNFRATCFFGKDTWAKVMLDFRSVVSNTSVLRVRFIDEQWDFPAMLQSRDADRPRSLTVDGENAKRLLRLLSSLPFPGIARFTILDQDKEEGVLRLFTTGTVAPKSDAQHARFPQPQSNPLSVMATFCERQTR